MCGALINVPEPAMEDRLLTADAVVPKRNDRIRLKEDTSVIILGYGATGEARRNELPVTQNEYPGLKDSTGRFAKAGRPYKVANGRVVDSGGGAPSVWVRLVAGR